MPYAEKRDGTLTGFWYGEVLIKASGSRFRRRFETKREAAGYEAYVRAAGAEPANLKDAKLGGPTFSEWLKQARDTNATWKRERDPSGQHRLDYIEGKLGHMTMPAITTTVLDGLVRDLAKRPAQSGTGMMSDGTINRYLAGVSAVFKFARAHQKPDEATITTPSIPWRKEKGQRIHWFSLDQEETIVPWLMAQGWLAEALTLRVLCATGMRWSEFSSLEPHQCQPEWILLDETKTDTPRDIPIAEDLAQELKAMVVRGDVPKYGPTRMRLKSAVKACGYSPKLGLHNARHGAATRLIKLGVALPIVQKLLGHKSIKTTMKYVHVEADDLQAAIKKLSPQRGYSTENAAIGEVVQFKKAL